VRFGRFLFFNFDRRSIFIGSVHIEEQKFGTVNIHNLGESNQPRTESHRQLLQSPTPVGQHFLDLWQTCVSPVQTTKWLIATI
jgi:hypothetical protein